MGRLFRSTSLACAPLLVFVLLHAEQLPKASGETLSGKQISLPALLEGRVSLLCIGFSRASQTQVKRWDSETRKRFSKNPDLTVYSVAVLEGAPRLIRGMIVRSIQGSVPASQHDAFLILYQGQDDLKRVTHFDKEDEAYVLLLDRTGAISWHTHGDLTSALLETLADQLVALQR